MCVSIRRWDGVSLTAVISLTRLSGLRRVEPGGKRTNHTERGKSTQIAPPWDEYGAPPGRRICAGDVTGRRISGDAGGGRRRSGRSLPASAQIGPAGESSPHSSACAWTGAAAGGTSAGPFFFSDFVDVFDRNEYLRVCDCESFSVSFFSRRRWSAWLRPPAAGVF
jgi:hypothetical protein